MSGLFKASSSKEFGKKIRPHNEKAWREKRVTRKALRDRKRKVSTHQSSLRSKLHRRCDWKSYIVVEKNQWENEGDDFMDYMSDEADMIDDYPAEFDRYDEWGDRPETTAMKMKRERESAQDFVNLIGDVLGGEFHGQEFVRPALESKQSHKTVAEFRIVVPDTTPRCSPEVWISLTPTRPRWGMRARPQSSRCVRLFRSGSNSLGNKTEAEFLDEILNGLFEISLPSSLVAVVSSFCSDSVSEFKSLAECCLTIGGDDDCDWFPGKERESCGCCPSAPRCTCVDSIHDIGMKVSAGVDCDEEYSQLLTMSHDWKGTAVDGFGHDSLCSSFDAYSHQRSRHVRTIMRMAKHVAVSWDEPASGMVVLPYKEPAKSWLGKSAIIRMMAAPHISFPDVDPWLPTPRTRMVWRRKDRNDDVNK